MSRRDIVIVALDRGIPVGGPCSIIGTTVTVAVVGGRIAHRSEAPP
jgi:hypothetical protein